MSIDSPRAAGKRGCVGGGHRRPAACLHDLTIPAYMPCAAHHLKVRSLVAGEKFEREKAQALVGSKVAAVTAGSPQVIAAFGDFYDSLSPAQQAKVREFLDRRRGWGHRG